MRVVTIDYSEATHRWKVRLEVDGVGYYRASFQTYKQAMAEFIRLSDAV